MHASETLRLQRRSQCLTGTGITRKRRTSSQAAISAAPEGKRPKVFLSSSAVGYYGTSQVGGFCGLLAAGSWRRAIGLYVLITFCLSRPPTALTTPPTRPQPTPTDPQTGSFTEDSPKGSDYLAQVCGEWEAAAQKVCGGGYGRWDCACVCVEWGGVRRQGGGGGGQIKRGRGVSGLRSLDRSRPTIETK